MDEDTKARAGNGLLAQCALSLSEGAWWAGQRGLGALPEPGARGGVSAIAGGQGRVETMRIRGLWDIQGLPCEMLGQEIPSGPLWPLQRPTGK